MKKTYETPVADLLVFDYKNNVVASETAGFDASQPVRRLFRAVQLEDD